MPIQSYLMMYFAGAGWQIGKRKISAIPNDEFNKMSANDLLKGFTADLRETIPTLERSLNDITPLIATLIEQYGDFIKIALEVIPQVAADVVTSARGFEGSFADWLMKQFPSLPAAEAKMLHAKFEKEVTLNVPTSTSKPFQGPEINPTTGEKSTFLIDLQKAKALEAAAHIRDRSRSNVSMQSLRLEKSRLQATIRKLGIAKKNAFALFAITKGWSSSIKRRKAHIIIQRSQAAGRAAGALSAAQQVFANFMKMHGKRF